jgi:hypothetical protein
VPEDRPAELAGLTDAEVSAIDTAWPVCSDQLPTAWTEDAALDCLAEETGIPRHDVDLVAFVHWLARLEAEVGPGR